MDISKIRLVAKLADRHEQITKSVKDFRVDLEKTDQGNTTITVPRSWLPSIIKIAEGDLAQIEEEIAKL